MGAFAFSGDFVTTHPMTLEQAARLLGPRTQYLGVKRNDRGQEISDYAWICDGCGKEAAWGPTWEWYGSDLMWDEGRMSAVRVSCSVACRASARASSINHNWAIRD